MTMLWDFLSRSVLASARGQRAAVVTDDATVTYAGLLERAEALSTRLSDAGVGAGHVVLAYLENGPAFLVALLATARSGAAFAPLDVGMTDAEVGSIVSLTGSDLVVCDAHGGERCARFSANRVCLDASGAVVDGHLTRPAAPSLAPSVGCIQFSSGTTAASKGILLSHEAFFYRSHFLMRALGLNEADRTLCTLPLSHTHGAECLALPTLFAGDALPEIAAVLFSALHPGGDRAPPDHLLQLDSPVLRFRGEAGRGQDA